MNHLRKIPIVRKLRQDTTQNCVRYHKNTHKTHYCPLHSKCSSTHSDVLSRGVPQSQLRVPQSWLMVPQSCPSWGFPCLGVSSSWDWGTPWGKDLGQETRERTLDWDTPRKDLGPETWERTWNWGPPLCGQTD